MTNVARWVWAGALAAGLALGGTACGEDGSAGEPGDAAEEGAAEPGGSGDAAEEGAGEVGDPDLRRELLQMKEADQADRTGAPVAEWDDETRTARLAEILDEHGWPGRSLVGDDGASAAWLVAQHSDLDVEFQERALEALRAAVDGGDADPTELAYLEDRVATNRGRPQIYGTQISCVDGRAEPRELAEPERVAELRAEVGLQPLEDYLAELEDACAAEAAGAG